MNRLSPICIALSLILAGCGGATSSEEDETMTPDILIDDECNTRNATSTVASFAAALLSTAMLAGCSDGDSNSGHTVSGTLFTAGQTVIDYDINDVYSGSLTNDDPFNGQPLPNVVTVQGFASNTPTNATATGDAEFERFANVADESDYYAVSLQGGQRIVMNVVDYYGNNNPDSAYAGDLDMYLYLNTGGDPIRSSQSETNREEFSVPADGDYILEVFAYSGISKYVLQILPASNSLLPTASESQPARPSFKPGEAIVQWKDTADTSAITAFNVRDHRAQAMSTATDRPVKLNLRKPASVERLSASTGQDLSAFNAGRDTLSAIKALNQRDDVEYAEPNYIRYATATPDDGLYRLQFHYADIRLPQAWDLSTGSSSVTVAVIDSGVFLNHEDLAGKLVSGYDFISDSSVSRDGDGIDSNPDDPGDSNQRGASSWHGTHVTGTIAAATNNQQGTAGAGWDTRVMPLRVLGLNGEGSTYDVLQAVRYAARLSNDSGTLPSSRADIINLSLGSSFRSSAEQDAFTAARNAGVIIVAAAGNSSTDELFYPASYDGVISVSATAPDDSLAYYSNFGSKIDVAAPGGDLRNDTNSDGQADGVLSTSVDDSAGTRQSAYTLQQGTSMATPHVAGVLALMKAVDPTLTPGEVDSLLSSGRITDDIGAAGRDNEFGHGLINALKAVQEANNLAGGGSVPQVPVLESDPDELQFGSGSSLTLTLNNVNDEADDPVITTGVSEDWLTVSPSDVDSNGFGEYVVTVDRADLVDGMYEGLVRFTPDTGNSLDVTVTMRVGDIITMTDSAPQYVLLEDSETAEIVAETLVNPNGSYAVTDVPTGSYRIVAGSDIDVDLFICQNGETCGGYPDSVTEEVVEVNGDVTDIDFVVSLVSGIDVSDDGGLGILRANPSADPEEPDLIESEPADNSMEDESDSKPVRSVSR